jgi:hypothetical protein
MISWPLESAVGCEPPNATKLATYRAPVAMMVISKIHDGFICSYLSFEIYRHG